MAGSPRIDTTGPGGRGRRHGPGRMVVRLALASGGLALVGAWLGSELVYQVNVALDDDGGLVPFRADGEGRPRAGQ